MGSKLLLQPTAANSMALKPPQKHTHTHTDTHLQDRRTRIAKLVRQKLFADLKFKNPLLQPQPAATRTTIHGLRTHRPPPQEILLQLNTTAVVAGVLSLWTKMEQQFPKIGGPENRAQKSFQNWTYLLAERKEVFSLFYMLGSQIMTPKWAQNWDPKNGFKTAPATHSCKFHGAKATKSTHTHTHRHTFAGQKNKNCKAGPAKTFRRSQV